MGFFFHPVTFCKLGSHLSSPTRLSLVFSIFINMISSHHLDASTLQNNKVRCPWLLPLLRWNTEEWIHSSAMIVPLSPGHQVSKWSNQLCSPTWFLTFLFLYGRLLSKLNTKYQWRINSQHCRYCPSFFPGLQITQSIHLCGMRI